MEKISWTDRMKNEEVLHRIKEEVNRLTTCVHTPFTPKYKPINYTNGRSQWPRGLRPRYTAARLLRSWVRIPMGVCMFVCCECCVLSGRGLCDELITRPEESYRLWCVVVCDLETSRMRRPWPALGRSATGGGDEMSFICKPRITQKLFVVIFDIFITGRPSLWTEIIVKNFPYFNNKNP